MVVVSLSVSPSTTAPPMTMLLLLHLHLHLLSLLLASTIPAALAQLPGTWEVLLPSAGIASMHTAVTRFNTVVLLDRTRNGPSRLPCSNNNPNCTAHSALFDPSSLQLRPLSILTDTWCSSGQFLPDGSLLQSGGDSNGLRKFRLFSADSDSDSDWRELTHPILAAGRWYATNQILPDGSIIIVGGRAAHSVEFYPPNPRIPLRPFPFLDATQDPQFDNLYPFVHLLPDGNLFVFANSQSILYDVATGDTVRTFPALPGGPRNYPTGGSSVLLPLAAAVGGGGYTTAEIIICGGAQYGVFLHQEEDAPAGTTCGRMVVTDPDPSWEMEEMPFPRIMGDMVILPTGEVLIINGAQAGSQGFELATQPCLNPVLYRPDQPAGLRFMTLTPTVVPRMYHSTANLLPDGRVLLAGSNPHYFYKFDDVEFPTELRLEAFSPEYLSADRANLRAVVEVAPEEVGYGEVFELEVETVLPVVGMVEVNLASAPFATHSFSQGQRLVRLAVSAPLALTGPGGEGGVYRYKIECTGPPDGRVAPPGFYMAFAVNGGVPSVAKWVQILRR